MTPKTWLATKRSTPSASLGRGADGGVAPHARAAGCDQGARHRAWALETRGGSARSSRSSRTSCPDHSCTKRASVSARARGASRRSSARSSPVVAVCTTVVGPSSRGRSGPARPIVAQSTSTRLFDPTGYAFQIVDALLTNFQQPRSTLLALVAASLAPRPCAPPTPPRSARATAFCRSETPVAAEARVISYRLDASSGNARAGRISTRHGEVPTPAFMPVGSSQRESAVLGRGPRHRCPHADHEHLSSVAEARPGGG